MSLLPRRRQPALAKTRGELRTYQACETCKGLRTFRHGDPVAGFTLEICPQCDGRGVTYLTDTTSNTRATKQAHAVRNAALDNHGRQPYD